MKWSCRTRSNNTHGDRVIEDLLKTSCRDGVDLDEAIEAKKLDLMMTDILLEVAESE